jgi:hypothetical protein
VATAQQEGVVRARSSCFSAAEPKFASCLVEQRDETETGWSRRPAEASTEARSIDKRPWIRVTGVAARLVETCSKHGRSVAVVERATPWTP